MHSTTPDPRRDEKQLFLAYRQSGDSSARDALVARFLPLAHSLARRYARTHEPLEDLEQVASLALIKAVDAFKIERGTAFSSYAVPCISGALKRHFRDRCWTVRPPRQLQELALKVARLNDELTTSIGAPPSVQQIAEHAGTDIESVIDALEAHRALHVTSLDRPVQEEDSDGTSLLDTLGARDPEMHRAFERVALDALLDTLDPRERTIVELYYQQELTQAEIGERLGYSQMHISRLLRSATRHLHAAARRAEESAPAAA